jgi:hypothetical protein
MSKAGKVPSLLRVEPQDELIETLASVGPFTSRAILERAIGAQWKWMSRYGDGLYALLSLLEVPGIVAELSSKQKQPEGNNTMNSSDGARKRGRGKEMLPRRRR